MSSTRSTVYVSIDDAGKPANLPHYETIIRQCFEHGPRQETTTNITGVRLTLEKKTDDDVSDICVKFGIGIAMSEAFTQRFVAQYLHDNNIVHSDFKGVCVLYNFVLRVVDAYCLF